MNTAVQPTAEFAARPTLPARRLNLGAAVLSLVVTTAVLGAVVLGMDSTADSHAPMAATSTSVQAG